MSKQEKPVFRQLRLSGMQKKRALEATQTASEQENQATSQLRKLNLKLQLLLESVSPLPSNGAQAQSAAFEIVTDIHAMTTNWLSARAGFNNWKLPPELLLHIFEYCWESWLRCSRVCKSWYISVKRLLNQQANVGHRDIHLLEVMLKAQQHTYANATTFNLYGLWNGGTADATRLAWRSPTPWTSVTTLNVYDQLVPMEAYIASGLPNLTKCNISGSVLSPELVTALADLPKLTHLQLNYPYQCTDALALRTLFGRITHLGLTVHDSSTARHTFANYFQNLEVLSIHYWTNDTQTFHSHFLPFLNTTSLHKVITTGEIPVVLFRFNTTSVKHLKVRHVHTRTLPTLTSLETLEYDPDCDLTARNLTQQLAALQSNSLQKLKLKYIDKHNDLYAWEEELFQNTSEINAALSCCSAITKLVLSVSLSGSKLKWYFEKQNNQLVLTKTPPPRGHCVTCTEDVRLYRFKICATCQNPVCSDCKSYCDFGECPAEEEVKPRCADCFDKHVGVCCSYCETRLSCKGWSGTVSSCESCGRFFCDTPCLTVDYSGKQDKIVCFECLKGETSF